MRPACNNNLANEAWKLIDLFINVAVVVVVQCPSMPHTALALHVSYTSHAKKIIIILPSIAAVNFNTSHSGLFLKSPCWKELHSEMTVIYTVMP